MTHTYFTMETPHSIPYDPIRLVTTFGYSENPSRGDYTFMQAKIDIKKSRAFEEKEKTYFEEILNRLEDSNYDLKKYQSVNICALDLTQRDMSLNVRINNFFRDTKDEMNGTDLTIYYYPKEIKEQTKSENVSNWSHLTWWKVGIWVFFTAWVFYM